MKRKVLATALVVVFLLMSVSVALAAGWKYKQGSKSYHGYTTIHWRNRIYDPGAGNNWWDAGYSDNTTNGVKMDQFHITVWTTYVRCNGRIDWNTYVRYENRPWMYHYNVSSIWDTMAQTKDWCWGTLEGYNGLNHWWQDNGYHGDGTGHMPQMIPLSSP